MPLLDLSRQTSMQVDVDATLVVSGIIDIVNSGLLDIIAGSLRIDGEPVNVSAEELNFLSSASSNIQEQLNNISVSVTTLEDTPWNITTLSGLTGGSSGALKDGIDLTLQSTSTASAVDVWFTNLRNISAVKQNKSTVKALNYNIHPDFHTGNVANNFSQWLIFINGQAVEIEAIQSIYNFGTELRVKFNISELGFRIRNSYEIIIWGPIINI